MPPRELAKPILLGTSNEGKLAEISTFARMLGFEVFALSHPSLKMVGELPHVAEVAGSYEGNSQLKAIHYARWARQPCIADDTGLEIPLLNGLPGVYTAPWGAARVAEALGAHRVVPARFVCCMSYAEPSGRVVSTVGSVDGILRDFDADRAAGSLPYSSFFYPKGAPDSMAEMLTKGFMGSHRFLALQSLVRVLS